LTFKGSIWGFLGVMNSFPPLKMEFIKFKWFWPAKNTKNVKKCQKHQKTSKNANKPIKTQKLGQVSIVQSLGTKMGAFCKDQFFSNLSRFPITRKPQFWHSKVSNGKLFNFFHMKDIQNPSRVTYLHVVRPCYTRGFHSKSNFQKVK